MDRYKITDKASILEKPLKLYKDLYNDSIPDKSFNLYKYIDIQLNSNYEILCISDIHADVHRFWTFLYRQQLVTEEFFTSLEDIVWNPQITHKALVICGDLIDGNRDGNDNQYNCTINGITNNEICLHIIIYNLRLEAIKHNCYIFSTLGNHDFFAFHSGLFPYISYVDTTAKENYIDIFENNQLYLMYPSITDIDKIYLIRTWILSRFYLIGFPFFLKINKTLFAHAGFHKASNIISLFENGQNSNTHVQPIFVHRKLLEMMTNFPEIYQNLKSYYQNLIDTNTAVLNETYDPELVLDSMDLFINYSESNTSISYNLFLTRTLQKDCTEVDDILTLYGCNMLAVGHCPTCLGLDIFNAENVNGITDCANARIVYSCNSKLITVDIASSSAFTPNKQFLECLSITKSITDEYTMKTIQHHLITGKSIVYNIFSYDNSSKTWNKIPIANVSVPTPYNNNSNSNSNSNNSFYRNNGNR
jgi:hypothetical protein